jgi:hypothetical protein
MTEIFKVILVSSNSNSFGLKQLYAYSKSKRLFRACANYLNVPELNSEVNVRVSDIGKVQFANMGWELGEMLPSPPKGLEKEFENIFN